jgi:hypothetical protein
MQRSPIPRRLPIRRFHIRERLGRLGIDAHPAAGSSGSRGRPNLSAAPLSIGGSTYRGFTAERG